MRGLDLAGLGAQQVLQSALGHGAERAVGGADRDRADLDALERRRHVGLPDSGRSRGAGHLFHWRIVITADPHHGDETAGVTVEPGVTIVTGRARLAGQVIARHGDAGTGAVGNDATQHLVHFAQRRIGDDLDAAAVLIGFAVLIEDLAGRGADTDDAVRRRLEAAVRERDIGLGHFDWRHFGGAERHGRIGIEVRLDAQAMGGSRHAVATDIVGQARRHGIDRFGQGRLQVDKPHIGLFVVLRRPVTNRIGFVDHRGRRLIAGFHGGQIDERLERRTGLTIGVDGAVELRVGIGNPADHGADTTFAVDRHHGRLLHALLGITRHDGLDGAFGIGLDRQVERRFDDQVFLGIADLGTHQGIEIVDEVLGVGGGQRFRHLDRCAGGFGTLFGRNDLGVDHFVENDGGAFGGAFLVRQRRIGVGRLHQPGQHGGFADAQIFGLLVEIALRRGFDTIGAGAEIDMVEVQRQNLFLGVLVLKPHRDHQLLNLALHVLVGRQEQVARQLLRDRRAAGQVGALLLEGVAHDGASHTHRIEARMGKEAAILDGDEGQRDVARQLIDIDGSGVLAAAAHGDQGAGAVEIGNGMLLLRRLQLLDVGQVDRHDPDKNDTENDHPNGSNRAPVKKSLQRRTPTAPCSCSGRCTFSHKPSSLEPDRAAIPACDRASPR